MTLNRVMTIILRHFVQSGSFRSQLNPAILSVCDTDVVDDSGFRHYLYDS